MDVPSTHGCKMIGVSAHVLLAALLLLVPVLFVLWGASTYRRLWRNASNQYEFLVYELGVKRFGFSMWVVMSLLHPALQAEQPSPSVRFWAKLLQ